MMSTGLTLPSTPFATTDHQHNFTINNALHRLPAHLCPFNTNTVISNRRRRRQLSICSAVQESNKVADKPSSSSSSSDSGGESAEEITKRFGLEAGLWKIFTSKDNDNGEDAKGKKKNQAKELLARYGGAYLATSISLSLVSFSVCYLLINSGVDVQGLLDKVGIHTDETGEKVGTFALAYAAHKAASPIRFPPTVALTPVVASWFGKKSKEEEGETKQ